MARIIQKAWRGRGLSSSLAGLFETVNLTRQMNLSKHRIRQSELLHGLVRRLLFFALAVSVVFMQYGRTVADRLDLETSVKGSVNKLRTPNGMSLSSLDTPDAFIEWINDALVPELAASSAGVSGSSKFGSSNRLVGTARVAQVRAKLDSCAWKDWNGAKYLPVTGINDADCIGKIGPGTMSEVAFGPWYDSARYVPRIELGESRYIIDVGSVTNASTSAFVRRRLDELRSADFISSRTRKLYLFFSIYNHPLPMLCFVTVELQVHVTGKLETTVLASSVSPHEYISWSPLLQILLEVLVLLTTVVFFGNEFAEMLSGVKRAHSNRYRAKAVKDYFVDLKNFFDLLLVAMTIAAAAVWLRMVLDPERSRQFKIDTTDFIPLETIAQHSRTYRLISCLVLLLHLIGLLPYLEMSDKLSLVTRSIMNAMADLPSFMIIFCLVLLSYAYIGHLLFGPHVKEWRSLPDAIVVCWDMMRWTGWRFERLSVHFESDEVAKTIAAVYYYSYVLLMQFMHANILTAILMAGYQGVRAEMRNTSYRDFKAESGTIFLNESAKMRVLVLTWSRHVKRLFRRGLQPPLLPWTVAMRHFEFAYHELPRS